jgi:hypothetical protein
VLGFVEAIPAVEGASFLPQAIQLGLPQLPVLQPALVSARPTVRPMASERTIGVRNIVQCIRGILSQTHRFPRRLVGETGEVFKQRNFGMRDVGFQPRMHRCIRNSPPACFGQQNRIDADKPYSLPGKAILPSFVAGTRESGFAAG